MSSLDSFLEYMIKIKASDLHLNPGYPPIYRVCGDLRPVGDRLSREEVRKLIFELFQDNQKEIYRQQREIDFAHSTINARFRCNIFEQIDGTCGAFRYIPGEIKSIKDLNLHPTLYGFTELKKGLVLVTGPTGSGKTTTLSAMIDHINQTRSEHILTIEDPIEYVYKKKNCLISQREIGLHSNSFSGALRSALREDPDIILVGEMRDLETIELALQAAETGHLVFSTLHTNSATKTIHRVVNVFPSGQQPYVQAMLGDILIGVCGQVLVPTVDHSSMVAVQEILVITDAIRNLIREGKLHMIDSAIQTGKKYGMTNVDDSLMSLLQSGRISAETAYAYAHKKETFESMLKKKPTTVFDPAAVKAAAPQEKEFLFDDERLAKRETDQKFITKKASPLPGQKSEKKDALTFSQFKKAVTGDEQDIPDLFDENAPSENPAEP